jgi:hypothetical protein
MIRRTKGLELMIFLNNPFQHIWFKSVFDLKNCGFENVPLTTLNWHDVFQCLVKLNLIGIPKFVVIVHRQPFQMVEQTLP